jgi:hypothetical protein
MSFDRLAENKIREAICNEIARLQRVVTSACDARVRSEAAAALRDQQLRLDILKEQRRRTG